MAHVCREDFPAPENGGSTSTVVVLETVEIFP